MFTDYRYKKTGKFNSDLPKSFDPKWGCLIPLGLFILIVAISVLVAVLSDS